MTKDQEGRDHRVFAPCTDQEGCDTDVSWQNERGAPERNVEDMPRPQTRIEKTKQRLKM